jgi:dGTPase
MKRFGDRFDHNLHALRIVESFEQRYARFPGLNLTFEVREGIVKHSGDFEHREFREAEEYLPGLRPPLEAQLIDLADEIAYNTADLDDGFSAGLFTMGTVAESAPQYGEILGDVEVRFPGAPERIRFQETLRRLIDVLVSGLIEGTYAAAAEAGIEDVDQVRRHPKRLACFSPPARATSTALKDFLHGHVYFSEVLLEERRRSTAVLGELFQFFVEHPERLPLPYCEQAAQQAPHRIVCDYIAGMTDGFFHRSYQKIVEGGA